MAKNIFEASSTFPLCNSMHIASPDHTDCIKVYCDYLYFLFYVNLKDALTEFRFYL